MGSKSSASVGKPFDDITECPICSELYTDPRSLPCVHTYCLICLDKYCHDKKAGDDVSCPMCRKDFKLPEDGVRGLPKNFFIVKLLLQLEQTATGQKQCIACEVCSPADADPEARKPATMLCLECDEKLCDQCSEVHKKYKASRSHRQVGIGEHLKTGEDLQKSSDTVVCAKHVKEQFQIHCLECKVTVCAVCFLESHNSHRWSEISKMTEDFRSQMKADVGSLSEVRTKLQQILASVADEKDSFNNCVASVENEINEQVKQVMSRVERDKQQLLDQLMTVKQNRMKQIEHLHENVEQQIFLVDGLTKYTGELADKGTSTDIARDSLTLHKSAVELTKMEVIEQGREELGSIELIFNKATSDNLDNVIGKFATKDSQKSQHHDATLL